MFIYVNYYLLFIVYCLIIVFLQIMISYKITKIILKIILEYLKINVHKMGVEVLHSLVISQNNIEALQPYLYIPAFLNRGYVRRYDGLRKKKKLNGGKNSI